MRYEVRCDETIVVDIPKHQALTNNGPNSVLILDQNDDVAAEIKTGQRWIHSSSLRLRADRFTSFVDVSECSADDMRRLAILELVVKNSEAILHRGKERLEC